MIRKLAAALLLSLTTFSAADEAPMFSVFLDHLGPVEVIAHELQFPAEYHGLVFMAVDLRLASGQVQTHRFEVPEESRDWTPGYVSHSHYFNAGGRRWYLGEQALWEENVKLHVEPKVFLPQVRLLPSGRGLEFFLDTEIFWVVGREGQLRGAFQALHAAS